MTVANLDLCKELYELSGWTDLSLLGGVNNAEYIPQYDLGYLLRKLPYQFELRLLRSGWSVSWTNNTYRRFGDKRRDEYAKAATPEDAAAQLLIQLIKQKVITP